MSVSYNTYIGPYIEVHNPPRDIKHTYYSCVNNLCNNYKKPNSDAFCSKCGGTICKFTIPIKASIKFDIAEEFNDRLAEINLEYPSPELFHYYISNKNGIGAGITIGYDTVTPIYEKMIFNKTQEMEKKFANEITRLREVFGKDKVSIKWGVICYSC